MITKQVYGSDDSYLTVEPHFKNYKTNTDKDGEVTTVSVEPYPSYFTIKRYHSDKIHLDFEYLDELIKALTKMQEDLSATT